MLSSLNGCCGWGVCMNSYTSILSYSGFWSKRYNMKTKILGLLYYLTLIIMLAACGYVNDSENSSSLNLSASNQASNFKLLSSNTAGTSAQIGYVLDNHNAKIYLQSFSACFRLIR